MDKRHFYFSINSPLIKKFKPRSERDFLHKEEEGEGERGMRSMHKKVQSNFAGK
jgi:hypothetical protein